MRKERNRGETRWKSWLHEVEWRKDDRVEGSLSTNRLHCEILRTDGPTLVISVYNIIGVYPGRTEEAIGP